MVNFVIKSRNCIDSVVGHLRVAHWLARLAFCVFSHSFAPDRGRWSLEGGRKTWSAPSVIRWKVKYVVHTKALFRSSKFSGCRPFAVGKSPLAADTPTFNNSYNNCFVFIVQFNAGWINPDFQIVLAKLDVMLVLLLSSLLDTTFLW